MTYDGPTFPSPPVSLGCSGGGLDPSLNPPNTMSLPGAQVYAYLTIDPEASGCITFCIGLGTCVDRVLDVAVFDASVTDSGNTVFAGDIQSGLVAITGILPIDGSLVCVSYQDPNVGMIVFLVDRADNSAATEPVCTPEFSIFFNAVCETNDFDG